ncbi:glycosyltransferase [Pediococcus sp. M21F004]|uniref:glycosyltransferase n=1 Tax=Pediococcus sp. M21F004 TaxID=3390033 RepID=UPI003DA75600
MILAVINIYLPGLYEKYIASNVKILLDSGVYVLLNLNDEKGLSEYQKEFDFLKNDHVFVLNNKRNTMPGYGFNEGMRLALKKNFDYCFFVDQDSIVSEKTVEEIKRHIASCTDFSFLATKIKDEKGKQTLRYFRGNLSKSMTFYSVPLKKYCNDPKINAAGYSGIIVKMSVVRNNHIYINETMGIELDDYDFTYRLSKVVPGYLMNSAVITHPNKKKNRNNRFGELVDAFSLLYFLDRSGRDKKHVENYRYLIGKYGVGVIKQFKMFLMHSVYIEKFLKKTKK